MEESDLRITTEPVAPCQLRVTVEVPEERVRAAMRETAQRIARDYDIPGFRKGKAPYEVIILRLGEETIRQEAINELVKTTYKEALKRENISPYAAAELDALESKPLRATFLIPLDPVVELGDYRSLRLDPPIVEVTEQELADALEEIRQQQAILNPISDRGAQPGDMLLLDVRGVTKDGTLFLKDEEVEASLDPDEDNPAPGFYQELVGAQPGETRTFRLAMPNEQPSPEAEFTVTVRTIAERILPNLDDDLARAASQFDSLEGLREHLHAQILEQKRADAEMEFSDRAFQALVDQANITFPPAALEEEMEQGVRRFEQLVQGRYRMNLDDYLKAIGRTKEDLRQDMKPETEARLRRRLVLLRFIAQEGLNVSAEEVEQHIAASSQTFGARADKARDWMESKDGRVIIESELLVKKAMERIAAIARGAVEQSAEA